MLLQNLFSTNRIKIDLEAEDKDEVFEELVDFMLTSYNLDNRDEILEAIQLREDKMSTGIKRGIALPHGKIDGVDGIIGTIGISRNGIDYDSLDGEPVYLIFLFVSSEKNPEKHLQALKRIAQLLEIPEFYNDILKAKSPDVINKVIKKYEELLEFQES